MAGFLRKLRGDTRAVLATVTPALKEFFAVTDKGEGGVGDGATLGGQLFARKNRREVLTPAQIVADQNDYAPAGYAHAGFLLLSSDQAGRTITGIDKISVSFGQERTLGLRNTGAFAIVLAAQSASSAAANRFAFDVDVVLAPGYGVELTYDDALDRWVLLSWLLPFGEITPATLTASVNDYAPAGFTAAAVVRLAASAEWDITGLAGGTKNREVTLFNVGNNAITLRNGSLSSSSSNRFMLSVDLKLKPNESVRLRYDTTLARWLAAGRATVVFSDVPQDFALTGALTPTQIVADQHDYAPAGHATVYELRLSTDIAGRAITGLAGGRDGRQLRVLNVGTQPFTLADASTNSTAANRFAFGGNQGLSPNQSVTLKYDGAQSRWTLQASTSSTSAIGANPTFVGLTTISQSLSLMGTISPPQLVANTNDWAPTGFADCRQLRVSTDASRNLTGLAGGTDGRSVVLYNIGANPLVLKNADAASTAANRFALSSDFALFGGDAVELWYDVASSRWRAGAIVNGAAIRSDVSQALTATQKAQAHRNLAQAILSRNSGFTVGLDDREALFVLSGGGSATIALTAAATLGVGFRFYVKNSDNVSGTWTIDPNGGEAINGAPTFVVRPGRAVLVICDGANFHTFDNDLYGVIDRNYAEYTTNANLTATIPLDDTIPQVTEGTQILSCAIAPKSTSNRVRVTFFGQMQTAAADGSTIALFLNGASDAVASTIITTTNAVHGTLIFEHVPGSFSTQTYTIRVGGSAQTLRLNGLTTGRIGGGASRAVLIVEELKA